MIRFFKEALERFIIIILILKRLEIKLRLRNWGRNIKIWNMVFRKAT